MPDQWYYSWNGQQAGPCDLNQLQAMIQSRQLPPENLVWKDGMADWSQIRSIPELAQSVPAEPTAIMAQAPMPSHDEPILEAEPPRPRKKKKRKKSDVYDEREEARKRLRKAIRKDERDRGMNWFDHQFLNTPMVLLILFPLCCGGLAVIFGVIGVIICENHQAKRNAILVLSIGLIWSIIGTIITIYRISTMKL
jgi:hypothetical protein